VRLIVFALLTAKHRLCGSPFLLKTGFWPSHCQISTDLDKILHTPIVVWNALTLDLKIGEWAALGQTRTINLI